jgi:hypothetical protein
MTDTSANKTRLSDEERIDFIGRFWDSQHTGLQPLGGVGQWPNPTGSFRDAVDAAAATGGSGTVASSSALQEDVLSREIVVLTQSWYTAVNLDHHKDRDCHFYLRETKDEVFSYGQEPKVDARAFVVEHHGYVVRPFREEFPTRLAALIFLRDRLKQMLADDAKTQAQRDALE